MNTFGIETDRSQTDSIKWLRYKDKDIIPLWVADMDFQVAPEIMQALHERVDHGVFGYGSDSAELKQLIVQHCQQHYRWEVKAEWIVLTPGVVKGLNVARAIAAQQGKPAGITALPVYPHLRKHAPIIAFEDQQFICKANGGSWSLDLTQMRAQLTDKTGVMLLCNPHNPIGKVYSREELQALADVCIENDLIICSDDIHCDLILNGKTHIPIASLNADIANLSITLMAPSKTFNIAGLDSAFAIIPNQALRAQYIELMDGLIGHVNILGVKAAIAAFKYAEPWRKDLIAYLNENRALVESKVNALNGVSMRPVEATYLAWINIANLKLDHPQKYFESYGIGLSPGSDFGDDDYVRLNFGCQQPLLIEALARFERAVTNRMEALNILP